MALSIREEEIQKLIRFYRRSIRELTKRFISTVDFNRPSLYARIASSMNILEELDNRTERWARRNIYGLYKSASRESDLWLSRRNLDQKITDASFAVVNEGAIQALLNSPEIGFLTALREGTQQIRNRMRLIQRQAKLLRDKQSLFDTTVARVGFLEGQSLNIIRDRLVDEMIKLKDSADLIFTKQAMNLPDSNIVSNFANLPFIKISDKRARAGFRRLRIDKYAEMIARTKTAQAANIARRNRAFQYGQYLMQISKQRPLQDDACHLYLGKAFALTEDAKKETGVPLIEELPNGGAPFHPNCIHQELVFVPEFKSDNEIKKAFIPPPAWSLNSTWGDVSKEFKRRGGLEYIRELRKRQT